MGGSDGARQQRAIGERTRATLPSVTERSFTGAVLQSAVPVIVCVGRRGDPAALALADALASQPPVLSGAITAVRLDAAAAPLLAELYAVQATPTLLYFAGGELVTRAIGYLPDGLLAAFCALAAEDALPSAWHWVPVETLFEDVVLVPLLERWGVSYQRQVRCPLPAVGRGMRGRIDVLIAEAPDQIPFTLFENKRALFTPQHLQQAAQQGQAYAQALRLPSFVVAAPAGLWVYGCTETGARNVARFTGLDLQRAPLAPLTLLRELAG